MSRDTHTGADAVSVWLQGMQTKGHANSRDWKETLHLRLSLSYEELGVGGGTGKSESELRWADHAYFSINCPWPSYELRVAVFRPDAVLDRSTSVTPFDSGGMINGDVHLKEGRDGSLQARKALVRKYNLALSDARDAFPDWINANYDARGQYEAGDKPSVDPLATEVLADDPNDARAWSWEARSEIRSELAAGLTLRHVYLTSLDWQDYSKWVRRQYPETSEEMLDKIESLGPVHPEPLKSMRDDLKNGRFLP
jgi:hypothetical protein